MVTLNFILQVIHLMSPLEAETILVGVLGVINMLLVSSTIYRKYVVLKTARIKQQK